MILQNVINRITTEQYIKQCNLFLDLPGPRDTMSVSIDGHIGIVCHEI